MSANLSLDGITIARHTARNETEIGPATTAELARRATGHPAWGVLRGSRRSVRPASAAASIHRRARAAFDAVQAFLRRRARSAVRGRDFWRASTFLYSGVSDFAVYGSWDALVLFAGEMQRTFHRFTEET